MPRITVSANGEVGPAFGSAMLMHQRLFQIESQSFSGPCTANDAAATAAH